MSGGSYDYSYSKVQDMSDRLRRSESALRRAFAVHLQLVADAMHDIEWVDSGDYGDGEDRKAITAVFNEDVTKRELAVVVDDARGIAKELQRLIQAAAGEKR